MSNTDLAAEQALRWEQKLRRIERVLGVVGLDGGGFGSFLGNFTALDMALTILGVPLDNTAEALKAVYSDEVCDEVPIFCRDAYHDRWDELHAEFKRDAALEAFLAEVKADVAANPEWASFFERKTPPA